MPNPTLSSLILPVKDQSTGVVTNVTYDLAGGGSGSGGHTIENASGTALTQRDTMQFGDGFSSTDDSTNQKTVITPDAMQSSDMEDVITPLPSVRSPYHKYSTTEQVVGEWINGKPLYERVITHTYQGKTGWETIDANINNITIHSRISSKMQYYNSSEDYSFDTIRCHATNGLQCRLYTSWDTTTVTYIIQYTKTTD